MLFRSNIVPKEEYLVDWPGHYFDIKDINMREACLKKYIAEHPDSKEDKRRLEIFERRFDKAGKKERGDRFIRSFMMILVSYKNNLHSFDVGKQERELRADLKELCVLDFECDELLKAEWANFADIYLETCSTHSYRSTLFGFVTLKDEVVADRMAYEIDIVTRLAPKQIKLEKECEALREIMVNAYITHLEGGQEYWNNYITNQLEKESV